MVVMANSGLVSIMSALMMLSLFNGYCISAERSKSVVMSIQTDYGDIYDCIDIYGQPAFDHPLLKNHTLQMEPSSYPSGVGPKTNHLDIQNMGLKGGGCPNGTIPIQRTQMKRFPQAVSLLQFGNKPTNFHHYATLETPFNGAYYGVRAYMNVWNPRVYNAMDFSISQIWLAAGPRGSMNTIEAGWMVNPRLYGDSRTRLFTLWTTDSYRITGCYNLHCPGFVHVNRNIPIDVPLDRISTYKGQQYEIKIDIFKDPKSGNWFLLRDDLVVGYWPNFIFNHLNIKAESVQMGGEVAQCPGCTKPQMGNGHFPEGGYGQASYMRGIKVIDNSNMILNDMTNGVTHATLPKCYRIVHNRRGIGRLTGTHIIYGGPGRNC